MSPRALRLDAYLPYRLSVASNAVSGLIARAYEDRFGLTVPQWRLMCVLAEDGPSTPAQIVARTVMDKVTVSRAAQGLLKRRLITAARNESDGRSHVLTMTDEGRRLHDEVSPLALAYENELIADLSAAEVETLHGLLSRIQSAAGRLASSPADPAKRTPRD